MYQVRTVGGEPLRVGDELVMPGLPQHKMRYVGRIGPNGEDVLDPAKGRPTGLVHLHSIPNVNRLLLGERGPENRFEQMLVQERARQVVADRVVNHTFVQNCEHIGSFVRHGKPESPQLKLGFGLGLAILLLCLAGGK